MPKKKTLGLFGGAKAQVRVFVELPDPKPKQKKKNTPKTKKEEAVKPETKKSENTEKTENSNYKIIVILYLKLLDKQSYFLGIDRLSICNKETLQYQNYKEAEAEETIWQFI